MAVKGFVLLRYSAPRLPEGAYNTFVQKAYALAQTEVYPAVRAAGATSWRILSDVFANSPRNTQLYEFESVDDALVYLTSPACLNSMEKFRGLGAMDLSITVCRLRDEGYL
jgi:hypothetical protein